MKLPRVGLLTTIAIVSGSGCIALNKDIQPTSSEKDNNCTAIVDNLSDRFETVSLIAWRLAIEKNKKVQEDVAQREADLDKTIADCIPLGFGCGGDNAPQNIARRKASDALVQALNDSINSHKDLCHIKKALDPYKKLPECDFAPTVLDQKAHRL